MLDLLAEFDLDCILAFFIVFYIFCMVIEAFILSGESGGFKDDELEIGLLYISFVGEEGVNASS
jgi:hypothetical protein